jgi:hypothetical protein
MEKIFVAQRLAKKLWATEAAVDAALVEAAELTADIIAARKEVNVASTFAGEVNVKLMAAMQALTEARTAMAEVHAGMEEAKLRVGIRTKMGVEKGTTPILAEHTDTTEMRRAG